MEESWLVRYYGAGMGLAEYQRLRDFAIKEFTPLIMLLGLFPPTDKMALMSIITSMSTAIYTIYIILFTLTCSFATGDFVLWSELIHHTSIMYLGFFMRSIFILEAQEMLKITRDYMHGIYNYKEGFDDPIFQELQGRSSALQRKLLFMPMFIVAVAGCTLGLKPLLDYLNEVKTHPALVEKGITYSSLIPIFYPFNNESTMQVLVMNGVLLYFVFLVVGGVIAANLIFVRVSCRISLELAILVESLNLIDKRARRLYSEKYELKLTSKKIDSWPQYQDCVEDCLKENIKHHQKIIIFYRQFSTIAAPVIGGGFSTCAIALGLAMIVLNMDNLNISDLIAFTGLVFAELMNSFMISWMSEKIGEQNYELYNAVYNLKWFEWRQSNKKLVITFLDGTREPLFLNAFGMATINMEAFGSVVNTAYSFLNLVNASD